MAQVAIDRLTQFSPFDHEIWTEMIGPLTLAEVEQAFSSLTGGSEPYEVGRDVDWTRAQHAERIAYLAKHGWQDKIALDVGVPCLGYYRDWWITDGHHRLAAAIFRGDRTIGVEVSGQLDYAADLLGVSEEDLKLTDAELSETPVETTDSRSFSAHE